MRPNLLLRYLRLLSWYAEARLSYLLSRAFAETLHFIWVSVAVLVALLCFSAALLLALAGLLGLPLAFLLVGLLWLLLALASAYLLKPWLHKRFQTGRHLYRLTLARAGLRLIEKSLLSPFLSAPLSPIAASLLSLLGRWLWSRLKTKAYQFLRKIVPL